MFTCIVGLMHDLQRDAYWKLSRVFDPILPK